jgi:hypothetical protein
MPSIKYMFGKVNKYPEQKLHSAAQNTLSATKNT